MSHTFLFCDLRLRASTMKSPTLPAIALRLVVEVSAVMAVISSLELELDLFSKADTIYLPTETI